MWFSGERGCMRLRRPAAALVAAILLGGCTSAKTATSMKSSTTTTSAIAAAEAYIRLPLLLYNIANGKALQDLNAAAAGTPQADVAFTEFENAALNLQNKVADYRWPNVASADAHRLVLDLAALVADYGSAAAFSPVPNLPHDLSVVDADISLLKTDVQW